MLNYKTFFTRADEKTLQDLLGISVVRHLRLYNEQLARPSLLREVLLKNIGIKQLLIEKNSRDVLFDLLRLSEARELAEQLKLKPDKDVFSTLKKIKLGRNTKPLKTILDFFGVKSEPVDKKAVLNSSSQKITSVYSLFPHQRTAVESVKERIKEYPFRVVLHMPTGAGKTRTTMNFIADHLRETEDGLCIWLANSEELCDQAAEEFLFAWKSLGNRDVELYRFWGQHEIDPNVLSSGLLVAGFKKIWSRSISNLQFLNSIAQKCTLVIMDEAHSAVADTYSLILDALVVQKDRVGLLGLTATPGRTWLDREMDQQLADFFSRKKVTLKVPGFSNPIDYLVSEGYLAEAAFQSILHSGNINLTNEDIKSINQSLDIPIEILNRLAEDEKRNLAILIKAEELLKSHRRILIFGISVAHSNLLATLLFANGYWAKSITSLTSFEDRRKFIDEYKSSTSEPRVLCNYGVLTTGFDAPKTSAAIIARPTYSLVLFSQMVGRVIRGPLAGGNKQAEIYTLVDNNLPGFREISESFNNWEDIWN